MKVAIIVAMDKELSLLLSILPQYKTISLPGFTAYCGEMNGHEFVVSKCGIGKVNAALRTFMIINEYHPELVINTGVAGGTDVSMHIGDILVANAVSYHDVWCGPGTLYGAADGFGDAFIPSKSGLQIIREIAKKDNKIKFGLLCSGDIFISQPNEVDKIKSHFPDSLGCDMESGAIAQVCEMENVPFLIIRVLSDMPGGGENISEYKNFWNDAPASTFSVLSKFLEAL